tara:strand:+ start:293 stop:463 length:171 start_codon:yes stop_codon:yes gene_type:complete
MNSEEMWYNLLRHPEHYRMNSEGVIVSIDTQRLLIQDGVMMDIIETITQEGHLIAS